PLSSRLASTLFLFILHPPPTALYTLSLHDALPIFLLVTATPVHNRVGDLCHLLRLFLRDHELTAFGVPSLSRAARGERDADSTRSEEHTSELQSHLNLVCRLLLEKKNKLPYAYLRM